MKLRTNYTEPCSQLCLAANLTLVSLYYSTAIRFASANDAKIPLLHCYDVMGRRDCLLGLLEVDSWSPIKQNTLVKGPVIKRGEKRNL